MDDINIIIKNRRLELGLTMLDLAKKVGVSEGTVSRWESGDIANMKRDKIVALAKALNLSPAIIMGWSEDPEDYPDDVDDDLLTQAHGDLYFARRLQQRRDRQNGVDGKSQLNRFYQALEICGVSKEDFWCTAPESPHGKLSKIEAMDGYTDDQYIERMMSFIEKYNISKDWIFEGKGEMFSKTQAAESPSSLPSNAIPYKPSRRIPILGRISAGLPLFAEEHIEGYTYIDRNDDADYFALRVEGDSMDAARMFDGDTLIVRVQPEVENGQIAIVMVGDNDATVKKFYRDGNMVTLMPQSNNPKHEPQFYDLKKTSIRVLGLVVKIEIDV